MSIPINRPHRSRLCRATLRFTALATVLLGVSSAYAQPFGPQPQKRDFSKGNTLYVVPYAHLDTQWRWAYPQVIREYIANTLHDNFKLIDKYPNYVFNFSGSRRYEMMKEYYPAEYARLSQYIKDGRWFPCGSSVDEGDANVPSGEALVRQVLYGNQYFRREFGIDSKEFMLPDCFGFPYSLPSILVHCGLKGFSTQKLTWGSANGIPFKVGVWEGPDGKSIVAALDPGAYVGDVTEDLSQNTSWLARIQNTGKQSGAYVDYHYYGTGDKGGAPNESSVQWVEKSIAGTGPIKVVSTRADEMFTLMKPEQIAKLPRYKGELLLTEHSAGSITSQAYMKRWNRKSELLADSAERASVAAMWLGGAAYPTDRLYQAWDLILGTQMHDMLPGTSIPKAYEFCWNDYLLAMNKLGAITEDAVGAVTSVMDTRAQGQALVVYNPLSIDREDVVEATLKGFGASAVQVYSPDGKAVPTQVVGRNGADVSVLFLAKVPSNGFASFDARKVSKPAQTLSTLQASGNRIENSRFRVTIDKNGDIGSVYDKTNKREVLKSPARLSMHFHNPRAFPAWNMDWEDAQKPPRGYVTGPAEVRVIENGPVRVTVEVERETDGSKFVQQIRLSAGSAGDRVEVRNLIDWQTKETALKATFQLNSANPEATYDLQLGAIKRGNNDPKKYEVPQHQWFDLTKGDGSYGVGVLNDSKYGSDKPSDDTVRLTLIYTPGVRGGYADQATQDIGRHEILYALAPHAGDWRKGDVAWSAKRLNQPLVAFATPSHSGKLGKTFSLLKSSNRQVEIQAVKKAEDSGEIIVRLRELYGQTAKSVQISAAHPIVAAREVDGQEMPLKAATMRNGTLITDVPAFSLKTFAIKLGASTTKAAPAASKPVTLAYDHDAASTDKNPSDGSFGANGKAYAAEILPASLTVGGVQFKLGSGKDGMKNAVVAKGQKIALPAGYSRVYLLAASSEGRATSQLIVGTKKYPINVQHWNGTIGGWDDRLWDGDLGPNFTNYGDMIGLKPGFVTTDEVAWYGSHCHDPKSGNTFYDFAYIYKYGFDVPAGATSLTLPNDPRIKVFAVSVAKGAHDGVWATRPLYDDLGEHRAGGSPSISPKGGTFSDTISVSLTPPLYWYKNGLRYTTDGSNPTAQSPVYRGPISVSDPTTIKAAMIRPDGKMGEVASVRLNVNDTTAPKIVSVSSPKALGMVRVVFSEKVSKATAENPASYLLSSATPVASAKLGQDGKTVELTLERPLPAGQRETIVVNGVKDLSSRENAVAGATAEVAEKGAVFASPALEPKTPRTFNEPKLPVKATDSWTLNLFCKIDAQPEDRTLIAGFGRAVDGRTGTGRYFTKFPRGINFWAANKDTMTNVPLDTGKWQMLTATYDGKTMRLYKNGELIAENEVELSNDQAQVRVMPPDAWERRRRFDGEVRDLTVWDQDLSPAAIKRLWEAGKGS
ncbi:MAG: chitobiase/beta-hexosaminidase C-terminal domain-containing protein [Fimbriimonadaceae bacterium]|nr:chitobiase/beta-hexosaminidase C-terminal domain-containing protein [Fimbriimonadaceae bacterium]